MDCGFYIKELHNETIPSEYKAVQCKSCLRFGHKTEECRQNTNKCMKCGQHQTTSKCTKMLRKCGHCEEPHSSNDRKCNNR